MQSLKNSVRLIGNLGANPEIKGLENGGKMARFNLATNETYIDKSGAKVTETQWHNLVAWGKIAEIIAEYVSKGSEIAIEGKLVTRTYEGKDGDKKFVTEIIINEVLMLGKKPQQS
ncbi:MAG: single-stranded DNA-binding protein [Saprospiraceae bacterium]|nr:single-stranded DNA-binding protein [Saprospiraceae bacterium]